MRYGSSYITRTFGWVSGALPRSLLTVTVSPGCSGWSCRVATSPFTLTCRWASSDFTELRFMPPILASRKSISPAGSFTRRSVRLTGGRGLSVFGFISYIFTPNP